MHHLWVSGRSLMIGMLLLMSICAPAMALVWQDVASELMSSACPGRTLINCTSGQSEQERELIRQKVAQGESKADIIRYFVEIHGEEILAAPPKKGFALAAWLLPLFVVVNGAGLIVVLTFRWVRNRPVTVTTLPDTTEDHLDSVSPAADAYRQRLYRELDERQL